MAALAMFQYKQSKEGTINRNDDEMMNMIVHTAGRSNLFFFNQSTTLPVFGLV